MPPDASQTPAGVYADLLRTARVADEVGFDELWLSSHHGDASAHLASPLVMLSAMAAVTTRLDLGTAVVLAPFQHPLRFAEDCAVLHHLSQGRLIVGLGAGWRPEEFQAFGIPIGERVGRTIELARVCRLAWDRERFSFEGKYFRYADVAVTPKPTGHLPLALGGNVPKAVARAGSLADVWIGTPRNQLEHFRERVGILDQAAQAAGRNPTHVGIGFHVNAWVSRDGNVPASVQQAIWQHIGIHRTWHGQDPARIDLEEIRQQSILGTPDDVVRQVQPWIEPFRDRELHLLFRLHYPGLPRREVEAALRLFASEVIPALKGASIRE